MRLPGIAAAQSAGSDPAAGVAWSREATADRRRYAVAGRSTMDFHAARDSGLMHIREHVVGERLCRITDCIEPCALFV